MKTKNLRYVYGQKCRCFFLRRVFQDYQYSTMQQELMLRVQNL